LLIGSVGGGVSSTARARLAGVMFSMVATLACSPGRATHQNVTFSYAGRSAKFSAQ
jgi:hypothetical protein